MALFVSDLEKARAFYKDILGYDEPYALKREDGSDRIAFIKINENQYLELFAESPKEDGRLNHISFLTDSAEGMRVYLASRGVKVTDKVGKGRIVGLRGRCGLALKEEAIAHPGHQSDQQCGQLYQARAQFGIGRGICGGGQGPHELLTRQGRDNRGQSEQ